MKIFGEPDEKTLEQARNVAEKAAYVALMADAHVGYSSPIGCVAAYRGSVSLLGIGVDISCGNQAVQLNLKGSDFDLRAWKEMATKIEQTISFGVGRTNRAENVPTDHPMFDDPRWDLFPTAANVQNLKGKARKQLGTVGGGNHYVDVFTDEGDNVWVGTHFGSRGFGFTTANGFLSLAQGTPWNTRPKMEDRVLSIYEGLGEAYWHLVQLAGEYATLGRTWVVDTVAGILGGAVVDRVENHHNSAWKEHHFDENLIVVRKGSTPAFPGQRGFVGGSMGDFSVILQGRVDLSPQERAIQEEAMFSTVHGAGRILSRTQAKGKKKGWGRRAKIVSPGLISREMMKEAVDRIGAVVRGGNLDEAPQAYRKLHDVLAFQMPTIEVQHILAPRIVCMAPPEIPSDD
jgi:tRNA-splicing ligase RtcB (3'-phosphate/5'-hydroxy nucleic acid ligase)